jgi:hypothetical protein
MKFIYLLSISLFLLSCQKDPEDKNPILSFTPDSDFTYTNQDTILITINSISTRPIQNITVSLVIDELAKDSIISEFLANDLEILQLTDTLLLNANWEDSLDMKLKISVTDLSQTKTYSRNVLFMQ